MRNYAVLICLFNRFLQEVWDKDPFTNEKMGHVSFDLHSLELISNVNNSTLIACQQVRKNNPHVSIYIKASIIGRLYKRIGLMLSNTKPFQGSVLATASSVSFSFIGVFCFWPTEAIIHWSSTCACGLSFGGERDDVTTNPRVAYVFMSQYPIFDKGYLKSNLLMGRSYGKDPKGG